MRIRGAEAEVSITSAHGIWLLGVGKHHSTHCRHSKPRTPPKPSLNSIQHLTPPAALAGNVAVAAAAATMDPRHDTTGFQMSPVPVPPLMNPPPQIFGAYGPDGMPTPAEFPDMTGPMFTDGVLLDESNEAKRRRIAKVGCPAPPAWSRG